MATAAVPAAFSQNANSPSFLDMLEARLEHNKMDLQAICPTKTNRAAERALRDYGAIFQSDNGGFIPPGCILESEAEVSSFQAFMKPATVNIGGVSVTLQQPAMTALLAARAEAAKVGKNITPRGGSVASTRSYQKTVDLWTSRFLPGLNYWSRRGKISSKQVAAARNASINEQVQMVLEWEEKGWFFSTAFDKSILYSVAIPGASQHNFMLALDVAQHGDAKVREVLAKHGWFQTVKSDAPHFTFMGVPETELPSLGLTSEIIGGQKYWYPNY